MPNSVSNMEAETNGLRIFIERVRRTFKPRMDYTALTTAALVLEAAKEWSAALEIVIRLIDRPEYSPDLQKLVLGTARFLTARAYEPKYLHALYRRNSRLEPLAFLLFHLFAAEHILAELSRRLSSPLRVATVLAAVSAPDGGGAAYYQPFLKALNIDTLPDYDDLEDPRDLRHEGVVGALEKVQGIKERFRKAFPKPLAFILTPELAYLPECGRWDWPEFHREEMARVWAGLGVYFHEEIERRSAGAWQACHDEYRKRDALKRGGPGRKLPSANEAADINEAKSDGKLTRGELRRVLHQEFDDEEYVSPSAKPEPTAQLPWERIARVARKHLGAKAATYFEERAKGARQNEAAKAAGVTDRMARKYQTRVSELLGIAKTPKKA